MTGAASCARAGAFAATVARARRHALRLRRARGVGRRARSAGLRREALGHADRRQQVRRRLRSPASPPAARRTAGAARAPAETDAQWIRKVTLRDPQTGWSARAAGDVPALRRAALRRCLPDRRLVQARRRHRAGRQAHLHRLPLLHDGLPVQGALVRARADRRPEAERAARQGHGRGLHAVRRTASTPACSPPASRPAPRRRAGR